MAADWKLMSAAVWPTVKPFFNGGVSGMLATCVIQATDNHISIYKKEYSFIRRNYEMAEDIQSEARKRHNDDESDRSNAD
ncbi:Mitochondrial dicarboxylate/tricarboxylate transporter DTC, partial [Cucurbita argyrosperma subsp. sororia]